MAAIADPVQYLKGVGPKRALLLESLGVSTVGELLLYLPRAWEDRRPADPRRPTGEGDVAVLGRVTEAREQRAGKDLLLFRAELAVPGSPHPVSAVWFKRASRRYDVLQTLKKDVTPGRDVWVVGKAEGGLIGLREVRVEEYYPADQPTTGLHVGRLTPIYPLTEGITNRLLREVVARALDASGELPETVPDEIVRRRALLAPAQAVRGAHFPRSSAELEECRRRLAFEELLLLELAWTIKQRQTKAVRKGYGYAVKRTLLSPFRERLGFEMTRAQKRVVNEIFDDMARPSPMTRLLQGDVGSGKTVVAIAALLLAVENGFQGAFMAPTEILAEQHHWTLADFLKGMPVRLAMLTSRLGPAKRRRTLEAIERGEADIVIGTHALLEGDVVFPRLRLAVIDEQHRFGVRQRATLRRKGQPMDLLLMTATPIPRTLSLALYGDLDASTLDEMPPGREPPETRHVAEEEAFAAVRAAVAAGGQAYVVYPIIEESELLDLKAAKAEHERLRRQVFPGLRVALVHGRMPAKAKIETMEEFSSGQHDILVATQVIEVGVDVPNATVMVVENADRFGLASLHQLRGRIGRGGGRSQCFLIADPKTPEARRRIEILCETSDGFRIGEEDLKLRGPGELLGTAQHGELTLRAADLTRDADLLASAKDDAGALLTSDPSLARPEHRALRERLIAQYQRKWQSIDIA